MKSRWFRLMGHEPIFDNSNLRALLPTQKQKVEQWSWRWDRRASRDSASQEVAPRFTSRLSHSEHRYLPMFRMDLLFPVRAFAGFRERPAMARPPARRVGRAIRPRRVSLWRRLWAKPAPVGRLHGASQSAGEEHRRRLFVEAPEAWPGGS